jgi:hypothetical protein
VSVVINHLGALLLVEVGGVGVEHHGLDGEVLGVLLPVTLLHLALRLAEPCSTTNTTVRSDRAAGTPTARRIPSPNSPAKREGRKGAICLPFTTATTGASSVYFSLFLFVKTERIFKEAEMSVC